ncbi:hypothetical protein RF11_13495 [Thelohanellus kitauei]|uniref:Paired domain-containing protein n=1 Tax=Thelohanellus kitauei TaxID=669202 RepID=A0A0C2IVN9_THEKT|nr:hypothetical protein RF11_11078 [Thelohanellus kitauei]KII70918.1 hypothetical protein RF11_13175 [Thelohanellus kitauei]KII71639.1 hypothetical protein RF11_13495 [Thelohanellus kitauei]
MSSQTRRKISQDTRENIIRLVIQQGRSKREVAKLHNVPKSTVNNIVKRYEMTDSTQPGITGGARRTVLNDEISEQIRNMVNDNQTTTVQEILDGLNVQVTLSTVWRWLKKLNFTYKMTCPVREA